MMFRQVYEKWKDILFLPIVVPSFHNQREMGHLFAFRAHFGAPEFGLWLKPKPRETIDIT